MIDMTVDTIGDLIQAIAAFQREKNEEAKAKKYKELIDETLPLYLQKFDKTAEENGGYLANGKFSWADIYFAAICDSSKFVLEFDITEKYLHLKGLCDKVYKIPQIKSWIAKRPEDIFPKL
ncbi:glutathione S-transferase-like [Lycorma delicatula]|uniref:glutathione S-transferase-like n=1 Tax=Lycorma delicatula TaxID=130591 RepID=UPI003F5183D4